MKNYMKEDHRGYRRNFFFSRSKCWGILASGLKPGGTAQMGYIDMSGCERNDIQTVYSRIGYINQRVWVLNKVSFSRKLIN